MAPTAKNRSRVNNMVGYKFPNRVRRFITFRYFQLTKKTTHNFDQEG